MTQQKNDVKKAKKAQKQSPAPDLRKLFTNLSQCDQEAVTTFFNLHNAAIFVYNNLSKDAQDYTEYCIKLSQEKVNV